MLWQLSNEVIKRLASASLLHDIGKLSVPGTLLNKPAPLTEAEFAIVKRHSAAGAALLQGIDPLNHITEAVLYHHERFDGTGYPEGKAGEKIPLMARILAISDVYEATTADRAYRRAMTPQAAKEILLSGKGTHFDPVLVDVFASHI